MTYKGLYLDGTGWATTTNPNITGDLTVIVELWKHVWATTSRQSLANVYEQVGDERSWSFNLDETGQLEFEWSTDGITPVGFQAAIPSSFKAQDFAAFKVEFDSNPGTVELFAAETEAGPWTSLGVHNIGSITTLHSSTAPLAVGARGFEGTIAADSLLEIAVVKKVQVYPAVGTGGTPDVDADFDAEARGTTTFVDNQANTWTLSDNSAIIDGQTPELALHLPDPTDIAKEWAEGMAKEWNELNVEAIDTFVGTQAMQTSNITVTNSNDDTFSIDGTAVAKYRVIGDLVIMWIDVNIGGSHTIPAAGFIEFVLPETPDGSFYVLDDTAGEGDVIGEAHLYDSDTSTERQTGVVYLATTSPRVRVCLEEGQVNRALTGDDPFTPAAGDSWHLALVFKKA